MSDSYILKTAIQRSGKLVKEPLKKIIRNYYQVEAYDPVFIFDGIECGGGFSKDIDLFIEQLREAIDNNFISLAEYEQLTDEDFDSQEDLTAWLEEMYSEIVYIKRRVSEGKGYFMSQASNGN